MTLKGQVAAMERVEGDRAGRLCAASKIEEAGLVFGLNGHLSHGEGQIQQDMVADGFVNCQLQRINLYKLPVWCS